VHTMSEFVHPPWVSEPGPPPQPESPVAPAPGEPPSPERKAIKVDGTTWEVPANLRFIKNLGSGTYGAVAAFHNVDTEEDVAIKKIPNPFCNNIEGKRCVREIKLLRALDHDCIIRLIDIIPPPSPEIREVCIVTELMDHNLHTVIASEQYLSDDHIQFFIYHILRALLYIHSANVVHRDLKPLNILVNQNCDIKLCDFGLARGRAGFSDEDDDFLRTEYVGTRWYRAPEVVLTAMEYTAAVDVWSTGCILGELSGRTPMFRGKDFLDQIRSICVVLGTPTESDLRFIPPRHQAARDFIMTQFPSLPRQKWADVYPDASPSLHDFLDKMLQFDPNGRMTVHELLRHQYLEEYHCEEDEVVAAAHIDWGFDDMSPEAGRLQCAVYHEAASLHPEILVRDRAELEQRGWWSGATAPATESGKGPQS